MSAKTKTANDNNLVNIILNENKGESKVIDPLFDSESKDLVDTARPKYTIFNEDKKIDLSNLDTEDINKIVDDKVRVKEHLEQAFESFGDSLEALTYFTDHVNSPINVDINVHLTEELLRFMNLKAQACPYGVMLKQDLFVEGILNIMDFVNHLEQSISKGAEIDVNINLDVNLLSQII